MKSVIKDAEAHARFLWREGELVRWSEAKVHVSAVGHSPVAVVFEGVKAYWNDDEVFFLGTGWEVLPISEVDGMPYRSKAPGPLTSQIRLDYSRLVRGQVPDHHAWLTPVWHVSDAQPTGANGSTPDQNRAASF